MTPSISILRAKHAALTHRDVIISLAVVFLLLGVVIAFTGVLTPAVGFSPLATTDEPGESQTHVVSVSQTPSVEISETTDTYTEGELITDRTFYPKFNTESLLVEPSVSTDHVTVNEIIVTVNFEAAHQSTGDVFHTESIVLSNQTANTDDGVVTVPFDDMLDRKESMREEFGSRILITTTIDTTVRYQYDDIVTGEMEHGVVTASSEFTTHDRVYHFPSADAQQSHVSGDPIHNNDDDDVGAWLNVIALLLIFGSVVGISATVAVVRMIDRKTVYRELQQKRYREWVTEVDSYTPQGKIHTVTVGSLPDLVNFAIDTQKRVLHNKDVNEYIVPDGQTLYKFEPDPDADEGDTELFGLRREDIAFDPEETMPQDGE